MLSSWWLPSALQRSKASRADHQMKSRACRETHSGNVSCLCTSVHQCTFFALCHCGVRLLLWKDSSIESEGCRDICPVQGDPLTDSLQPLTETRELLISNHFDLLFQVASMVGKQYSHLSLYPDIVRDLFWEKEYSLMLCSLSSNKIHMESWLLSGIWQSNTSCTCGNRY